MDYGWNDEYANFRNEVRQFIKEISARPDIQELIHHEPEEGERMHPGVQTVRDLLDERGWLKMCWAPELGGQGKSPWYQYMLGNELNLAGIPYQLGVAAMIGPAITTFGTDVQKEKYLPDLYSGKMTAALGYSEPNAGTDLASLQTRAVRDGDEWVINGQKIWTTGAHASTHVWLATRTDPEAPKHRGISMFIVPLNAEGITVRPIYTMSGTRTNEVFFEDVRVPGEALIGEENRGWYIAANALDHERVTIAGALGLLMMHERLMDYLRESRKDLLADEQNRLNLANQKVDLQVARALSVTNAAIVANGGTPTMEASMVKVWTSELRYRMTNAGINLFGRYGALRRSSGDIAPMKGEWESGYRGSPILRFGGGTNEVQRGIVAQRGLGLPR